MTKKYKHPLLGYNVNIKKDYLVSLAYFLGLSGGLSDSSKVNFNSMIALLDGEDYKKELYSYIVTSNENEVELLVNRSIDRLSKEVEENDSLTKKSTNIISL